MGEDFCLLPKGALIIKLPRISPMMVNLITVAAVVVCGIYISSICLRQTAIQMKPDLLMAKPVEKHSIDSRLVSLKKTETQIKPELMWEQSLEEDYFDPIVVGSKQTEIQINEEVSKTKLAGHSYDSKNVALEQAATQAEPEIVKAKQMEDHSSDSRIVGWEQPETDTKPKSKGPILEHPSYPTKVDPKQMNAQIKADIASMGPDKQSYNGGVSDLKQAVIQRKQVPVMIKPSGQHLYEPQIVSLKEAKMHVEPESETITQTDRQPSDPRITGANQTEVQVKPKSVGTGLKQPPCQNTGIPQSEIPYIHYPVPTKFSRGVCACTPVRFYVIISLQRSGSKWLESLLSSHDNISANGEIFIDRDRSANVSILAQTLDTLYNLDWKYTVSRKRCTAAVGFKWMLNQRILENQEVVTEYFKRRGVSVILLFRRNLLRRMVSLVANAYRDPKLLNGTHKAHVNKQQEADALASYRPKLGPKLLVSKLKHAAAKIAAAKEMFKSIRHMDLYYEDLVKNNTQKLAEVMDFLRVPQRNLSSGHVKIHTRPLSDMIRNWNAVRRALKRTEFASFLTSE